MPRPAPPAPQPAPIRLIVGLGNPGREYERTRHNVGFLILDRLAQDAPFERDRKKQAEIARWGDIWLVKPQTYMNLSGEAVKSIASFYRIPPASTLVVYDDKDLPFGALRLRESGSAGGHNGIKSLIAHLGTQDFPRLRFGIGAPSPRQGEMVSHVLGEFSPEEHGQLQKRLDRAVEALNCAARFGFPKAMNLFNRPDQPSAPQPAPASPAGPPHTS